MMDDRERVRTIFQRHFTGSPRLFRAPGRVNLIGEHTDYNDGYVFPMAIDRYCAVAVRPRTDRALRVWSENMGEAVEIDLAGSSAPHRHWSDYVTGMARVLADEGIPLTGADMAICSDVPVGSGLSSSAAIEISSALALLSTVNAEMERGQLARLGQRAENEFVGMNCGIMDQFISLHGEEGHALFLDCRTLGFEQVPLGDNKIRIVICNTMVRHELGESEYNKRRAECEQGVELMRRRWPQIRALRDVELEPFESHAGTLPEVVRRRCRHVISENERTMASVEALRDGALQRFGELMNESHDSLRDDYQVSCSELDTLVEIARDTPGIWGARMTGGGFGGCTVNLVSADQAESFCARIAEQYEKKTGLATEIYVSMPARGAHEW